MGVKASRLDPDRHLHNGTMSCLIAYSIYAAEMTLVAMYNATVCVVHAVQQCNNGLATNIRPVVYSQSIRVPRSYLAMTAV